jgi:hypothetical protein
MVGRNKPDQFPELLSTAVNITYGKYFIHHGNPQSKLWMQIPQQAAVY